jgi:DNA modification methylase
MGFDNLQGVTWLKVSNIKLEASTSSRFLGKPNLPNGIVKNDTEHILFLRKPGYRSPSAEMERASYIETKEYMKLFTPIWDDIRGASLKHHPAPYPLEIATRLIRMFSFVGDVVLDPFGGTGTTALAALQLGRSSVTYEVEEKYLPLIIKRLAARETLGGNVIFERREPKQNVTRITDRGSRRVS